MTTTSKPTSTSPVEMAPIEMLPTYLMLVTVLNLKCKTVKEDDDANLIAACAALTLSVQKYRSFLAPLGKLLPAASDLRSGLSGVKWDDRDKPIISPEAFRKILKNFHKTETLYRVELPGDRIHDSFFSSEKLANRKEQLATKSKLILTEEGFVEQQYALLTQARLSRQESGQSFGYLYQLMIASLIPQILILTLVLAQWLLLKRRARAARKRNEKIAREQQLLGRLMEMRTDPRSIE